MTIAKQQGKNQVRSSKIKRFISKNWLTLATLLFSLLALFLSIQSNLISNESNELARDANRISFEAANANLRLVTGIKPSDLLIVNIFGCYSHVASEYEVVRYVTDSITISNTGGRATALVAVTFDDGYGRDYSIRFYENGSFANINDIIFPLQFDTGETKIFYVSAVNQFDDSYMDKQSAIQSAHNLQNLNEPSKAAWKFMFGDNSIITNKYKQNYYSVSPFFETYLDSNCNY